MILLLGSSGQLGTSIGIELSRNKYDYVSLDFLSLDVTKKDKLDSYIKFLKPKIIINASAYTNVNKADQQKELAEAINVNAIKSICEIASSFDKNDKPIIIHYSTDYVFDGKKGESYEETDKTHPLNFYGTSKRNGELVLCKSYDRFFIIRTSWLFSEHGNNFIKTISNKLVEKNSTNSLNIVNDQFGSPTSAKSLADVSIKIIAKIINKERFVKNAEKLFSRYGLYHFSGCERISWFDFGRTISSYCQLYRNDFIKNIDPICSNKSQPCVPRPSDSVLNCTKIRSWLALSDRHFKWHDHCKLVIKKNLEQYGQ